jgi:hypothetical protein
MCADCRRALPDSDRRTAAHLQRGHARRGRPGKRTAQALFHRQRRRLRQNLAVQPAAGDDALPSHSRRPEVRRPRGDRGRIVGHCGAAAGRGYNRPLPVQGAGARARPQRHVRHQARHTGRGAAAGCTAHRVGRSDHVPQVRLHGGRPHAARHLRKRRAVRRQGKPPCRISHRFCCHAEQIWCPMLS